MKSWLQDNDVEIYPFHTKNKIFRHMTAVSKNVFTDNLMK